MIAIGCLVLSLLCCCCGALGITLIMMTPTADTSDSSFPEIAQTEGSTPTRLPPATPTPALTQESTPTSIPEPTRTPSPPTATVTPTPEALIAVFEVLGMPAEKVDNVLGPTILITPNDDGDDNLDGGEYRDYKIEHYTVTVAFDKNGIARVFQVWEGLSAKKYALSQWREILPQFGVHISSSPDRTARAAVHWDNYNGYHIAVFGNPVWSILVAEAAYAP